MIKNTKQNWELGSTVKVGFMSLKVEAVQDVYDGKPDIYTLSSV